MQHVNTRRAACNILLRATDGAYAQLLLQKHHDCDARDIAFITTLVYGTLEKLILLDAVLSQHVKGGVKKLDKEVACVLRIGAYQILFMDSVPEFAAVKESVSLCRSYKKSSAAGLVNAVLRKVRTTPIPNKEHVKYCVHPDILKIWKTDYPLQWERIAKGIQKRPTQTITVNVALTDEQSLTELLTKQGFAVRRGAVEGTLLCDGGALTRCVEFEQGLFYLMGSSSTFAAAVCIAQKPESVLDLCAAPGGKTAYMAMRCKAVTAAELHPSRVPLIGSLCERLRLSNVTAVQNDATKGAPEGEFDAVLCDVPCTGTGVLAKKPELRHHTPPTAEVAKVQSEILDVAATAVKVGGHITYSTCALSRAENDQQVKAFLHRHENFSLEKIPLDIPELCESDEGSITFFPDGEIFDGFYIAFLKKMW